MISSLILSAVLSVGQCSGGICNQTQETHYIQNAGVVTSRQDVWVKLPNGHTTTVPVLNGYLPYITYNTDSRGKVTAVYCNYQNGVLYGDRTGIVAYSFTGTTPGTNQVPVKDNRVKAPKHPDNVKIEKTEKVPAKTEIKAPAPKLDQMLKPSQVEDTGKTTILPRY